MLTFFISGQTPHGFKTSIRLADRDIAERLWASWTQAGFINMTMEDQQTDPVERVAMRKGRSLQNIRRGLATIVALIPELFSKVAGS